MDLITNAFRTLMFFFDNIVYGLIPTIYTLLLYLSQIDIFSTDTGIGELVSQIYTLLGIFMLFKISFSILQYLIDPNAFSDSSKGFGKLLKNVIVALILLVMVPFIFQFAAKLQYVVVNSNILGNLILGSTSASVTETDINLATTEPSEVLSETSNSFNESAKDLQFLMYGAFFSVNTDVIPECEGTPIFGSVEMAQNTECLTKLEEYFESETDISSNNVTLGSFFKYANSSENPNPDCENGLCDFRDFKDFDKLLWWRVDNEYAIDYLPVISVAAGIYVIFLLITFCIDIAVRSIKLCFLQMVAPISIVSYIDPKESMGNSKLRNWVNECLKTYVSLFIRLAVIFFVMRLISIIASGVFSDEGFVRKLNANEYTMWIYLFLVLGAFMFAKQVPKMIETLFGWKNTGELQINPFKAITSNPLAGGIVAGGIGAAAGAWAGARAGSDAGATGKGALFGALTGVRQGLNTKDKIFNPGSFGKVRKGVYKDMTGNDLATFNPMQRIMSAGSKKHIDEIKAPLKNARKSLNEAHSRLSVATNETKLNSEALRSRGINISKLGEETENNQKLLEEARKKLAKAKANEPELNAKISGLNKTLEKEGLDPAVRKMAEQQKAQLEKQLNDTVKLEAAEVEKYESIDRSITAYNKSLEAENAIRSEISKIEGDIKTLSGEKSQRENFYNVDKSPKDDVQAAINKYKDDNK